MAIQHFFPKRQMDRFTLVPRVRDDNRESSSRASREAGDLWYASVLVEDREPVERHAPDLPNGRQRSRRSRVRIRRVSAFP